MLLELHGIRVESNNPAEIARLKSFGYLEVKVIETVPVPIETEAAQAEKPVIEKKKKAVKDA